MLDRFKLPRLLLLAIAASLATSSSLWAQDLGIGDSTATQAEAPPAAPLVPAEYASPRATLKTFLDAINKEQPDGERAPEHRCRGHIIGVHIVCRRQIVQRRCQADI